MFGDIGDFGILRNGMYYDIDGKELSLNEYMEYASKMPPAARRIGGTPLWWGGWVSTVYLGLNHNLVFGGGKPLIFETMVFKPWGRYKSLEMDRYSTKEEAKIGHEEMVKRWKNPLYVVKYCFDNRDWLFS